ncbi:MAG: His/Gly/Thr/Pro-type tRNA ligase C-terminal domain-containing protein [Patescibacteria group bacterium]|nr:His/Gly/Thr/Pro-type tRNA ligase C-terminal domain-containing protein [Patescibacteria group bacterium]
MLQSKLFSKTQREDPREEESVNAKLLIRAGYVDKTMAGVYAFLPLGWRVISKIAGIIRKEMEAVGGEEILMPTLQPKKNWETTGRYDTYDTLFKFQSFYTKTDYVLGPTHEEIVSPLISRFVSSYKDLPVYVFQIQNKFRDEKRSKSGLLRGREFLMKDLYSFHADEKELEKFYEKVSRAYVKIFRLAGIGKITYLTYASGGDFSKYSHEFQTVTPAGEDVIYLCEKCKVAVNREIIDDLHGACPVCGNKNLKEEKAIEVGNIFKLKTRFSSAFGLKFAGADSRDGDVLMGCYGIGLNRLMGTIVEVSHDDKGIIWPESVAPFKFHIIELKKGKGRKLYEELVKSGAEVLYDDRDSTAGEKFADADLIGIPWRLVVSDKTGEKVEIKKRGENKSKIVSYGFVRQLL